MKTLIRETWKMLVWMILFGWTSLALALSFGTREAAIPTFMVALGIGAFARCFFCLGKAAHRPRVTILKSNRRHSNPFLHDLYNMGTPVAANCMIMHGTHPSQIASYVIIVDTFTGKRVKVHLPLNHRNP